MIILSLLLQCEVLKPSNLHLGVRCRLGLKSLVCRAGKSCENCYIYTATLTATATAMTYTATTATENNNNNNNYRKKKITNEECEEIRWGERADGPSKGASDSRRRERAEEIRKGC